MAEEPIVFDGIGGISGKVTTREKGKGKIVDLDIEMEVEAVPVLINRDLPTLQSVLEAADVIIQVLDARDPLAFLSTHLEEISSTTGKKTLLILNKIGASLSCPLPFLHNLIYIFRYGTPGICRILVSLSANTASHAAFQSLFRLSTPLSRRVGQCFQAKGQNFSHRRTYRKIYFNSACLMGQ